VVVVGLTAIEPLADVSLTLPGLMVALVAPVVFQLISVLPPETTVGGLAVKELMVGRDWAKQVTDTTGAIRARSRAKSLIVRGEDR
jgi:hypothetical protein